MRLGQVHHGPGIHAEHVACIGLSLCGVQCRLIKAKIVEAGSKPWILVTFAVETPEGAQATAERLGQETAPMLRIKPGGQHLTWRVSAMSKFGGDRAPKPFFITWDDPSMRPDKVC